MRGLRVHRDAEIPDRFRIERCLRLPELGPRILFFSGGSALRKTARVLKRYTHNSIHVITAFDSGGSSKELRRVFSMPSIGDLRNRLLSLADESVQGNPEIYQLFSHRLPWDEPSSSLHRRFDALLRGEDPLVAGLPPAMARIVRTQLRSFADHAEGRGFDLRGASIGNLILAAGYLDNERHMDSVLFLFSKLVGVLGQVLPVTEEDIHLAAELSDGTRVVGQHRFGQVESGIDPVAPALRIERIELVDSLDAPRPVRIAVAEKVRRLVESADLICFPMGSFYSSVVANLLVDGVRDAVARAACPRVYIPNTGLDPEQSGRSVADCVEVLLAHLKADAAREDRHGLDFVLLDRDDSAYAFPPERERISALGIQRIELDLAEPAGGARRLDPERIVEVLVSLA